MSAYELTKTILKDSANLKAYYRFESGALTTDSSGSSHTLSAIGTPTEDASGKYGGAVAYASASSQAHSAVDNADFKPTGAFSVGFWMKTSQTGFAYVAQSFSLNTKYAGWAFSINGTANKIEFISGKNTGTTGGTDWQTAISADSINSGAWTHVVGTSDGTTLRIYVNGRHSGSTAWANHPAYAATNYVRIACQNLSGTNQNFYNGSVDDFFVINGTALSADQIKELYEGRYIGEWWPQTNLVGLWHLNGNSTDTSGNNNHGTDTAITYSSTNGKMGTQGAGFNGSTSNISLADSSSLDITGNITCMFWVKFAVLPTSGNDAGFFCKWNYGSSGQNSYSYGLYNNSGTYQFLMFRSANGTAGETHQANLPSLTTGVWHHYAMSTTIASHSTDIFYDGNLIGTATNGVITSIFNGNLAAKIGMYTDGVGKVNGAIDEVAIFSRALTAAEIRKWYAWSSGRYI